MMFFKDSKRRKYYIKSFDYGKREHKYERYATATLLIMLSFFIVGIYFKLEILFFYILFVTTILSLFFRLLAHVNHKREKKYRTRAVRIEKELKND